MDMSPAHLLAGLVVGSVGLACFMYGKKQARLPQLVAGIALLACPYLVSHPAGMLGAGGAISVAAWLAVRAGL